jgi:hypothetical protein
MVHFNLHLLDFNVMTGIDQQHFCVLNIYLNNATHYDCDSFCQLYVDFYVVNKKGNTLHFVVRLIGSFRCWKLE